MWLCLRCCPGALGLAAMQGHQQELHQDRDWVVVRRILSVFSGNEPGDRFVSNNKNSLTS